MRSRLSMISDEYRELLDADALVWTKSPERIADLVIPQGRALVMRLLQVLSGLGLEVADKQLDDTLLLRLDDKHIKYLLIDPITGIHLWASPDFRRVYSDEKVVASYFLAKRTGLTMAEAQKILSRE